MERAIIQNPVLALPAVEKLLALEPASKAALRAVLLDLAADAKARAKKSWETRKAPMAAYWYAVGVYAGHLARVLAKPAQAKPIAWNADFINSLPREAAK